MPNRIIKESVCTSDNLNSLTPEEEVFFYRIITNCDDYGIADARLPILRSKCFPLKVDIIKENDIEKWLNSLILADLIYLYEVDNRRYLKMKSWESHQQVRSKRSKFPLPNSVGVVLIADDIICNQMISDDSICYRNPIQSNPIQKESESESNLIPDIKEIKKTTQDEFFNNIWNLYPLKKGKGKVNNKQKQILQKLSYEVIELCILRYAKEMQGNEEYLQHGSTFFNSGYIDYLEENYQEKKPAQIKNNNASNLNNQIGMQNKRQYDVDKLEKNLLGRNKEINSG